MQLSYVLSQNLCLVILVSLDCGYAVLCICTQTIQHCTAENLSGLKAVCSKTFSLRDVFWNRVRAFVSKETLKTGEGFCSKLAIK